MKDVIYNKEKQEEFMKQVKIEIENSQTLTPLKKREMWKVIKETRFPIFLGLLVSIEGFLEVCSGAFQLSTISLLRTGVYIKMT